jgi:hypothetical protein
MWTQRAGEQTPSASMTLQMQLAVRLECFQPLWTIVVMETTATDTRCLDVVNVWLSAS